MMKRLHCTQCGANLTKNEEGDYCCEYCGSVYKSKREKGRVFVKDSYYKFDKEDTVKDIAYASQSSDAEFSYKKVKLSWVFIPIILAMILVISLATIPPKIKQNIEDKTPQTITYTAQGNGYLLINGEKLKHYTCELIKGQNITVQTVADENYKFSIWSDNRQSSTRTDTKTGKYNMSFTAYFVEMDKFTLIYSTSVTAVANEGYYFTGWSDGYYKATRTDDYVTENINVYAKFYCPFDSGVGTKDNPYIIANTEHFLNMESATSGMYFKLKNNIDFKDVSDFDWKGFEFKGYFDGNNFSITNTQHALFINLSSAEIKNLVIDDASIYNTLYSNYYSGILANSISGNVKITNCTIKNSFIDLHYSGVNDLGLFVGLIKRDSVVVIDGCTVESSVATSSTSIRTNTSSTTTFVIGGIVGYVESNVSLEIKNTNAKGTLSVSSASLDDTKYNSIYAGGLIGHVASGCDIKITDDVIAGKLRIVSVNNNVYVAGLIGNSYTKADDMTLNGNSISMEIPESNTNTRTNVYYEEILH